MLNVRALKEIDFRDFPQNKFKVLVMFEIEEMLDRSDSEWQHVEDVDGLLSQMWLTPNETPNFWNC